MEAAKADLAKWRRKFYQVASKSGPNAKLGAVQGALSDLNENNDVAALNAMYAFCYNVQTQSGKKLEEAEIDQLISKADAIIAAIDPAAALCSE